MRIYTGDSVTLSIPLRWRGGVFEPGEDWGLIFTAKNDPLDDDADAVIQKATGAGITVAGSTAAVEIVPQDTATLTTATLHCDIQAQETTTGEVRTVWVDELELRRDITRDTTTSVDIYTTQPGYPNGAEEWNDLTGTANHIPFDTTPTSVPAAEGVVSWNADDNTLDIQTGLGGVVAQVGQEQHVKSRNNSGATIANGAVVYLSGASGQRPTIALADANEDTHVASTIGLATAEIGNNSFGMVTTSGLVRGINTAGMTEGGPVYLSETAGGMTQTAPTSNVVRVGWCIVAGNNGTVLVHVEKMSVKSADVLDASSTGSPDKLVKYTSSGGLYTTTSTIGNSIEAYNDGGGNGLRGDSSSGIGVRGDSESGIGGLLSSEEGTYHAKFGESGNDQSAIERVRGWFVWFFSTFTGRLKTADITANREWTLGDWSGDIAGVDATQTLTNKTLENPVFTKTAQITSPIPGLTAWIKRPISTFGLGVVSDSTGAGTWVSELARLISEANPSVSIKARLWGDGSSTMDSYTSYVGSGGDRYIQRGDADVTLITPFSAATMPAGDCEIRCKLQMDDWTPSAVFYALNGTDGSKWWNSLAINTDGKLMMRWADTSSAVYNRTALSSVATGLTDGSTKWIRATLDINNGSGASTVQFFLSDDGETWTQLGTSVTVASSLTMTTDLPIQVYIGSTSTGLRANVKLYELEWRDGIGAGSRVLSPIGIDHWIPNVPANLVVSGSPTLKIYNASKPGSASSYWTEANLKKALPIGLKAVILAHGHNDLVTLSQNFDAVKTIFDGLRTRVNSAVPNASVSLSTQNPVASTFRHYYMQNAHVSSILQVAAGYGLPIIDVYSAMVDGGFTDSWVDPGDLIHPTWETYEWWGAYVYQILKS